MSNRPKTPKKTREFCLLALDHVFRMKEAILCAEYGDWIFPIQFLSDQGDVVGDGMGDEYYAARDNAAIIELSRWEVLKLDKTGQIAALDRVLTRGARGLAPGQSRRSAWLDFRGYVRALVRLLAVEDGVLLECPREAAALLARELGALRPGKPRDPGAVVAFGLLGPKAGNLLLKAGLTAKVLTDGEHAEGLLPGPPLKVLGPDGKPAGQEPPIPFRALRTDDLPCGGWLLYAARGRAEAFWKAWKSLDAVTMAYYAFDMHRVEQGRPWYGLDIADCTLEEAGLKDCLAERTAPPGKPAMRLRRLMLDAVASEGHPVKAGDGREIGRITTYQLGVSTGLSMAFGFVREPWCEPGTLVRVSGRKAMVAAMEGELKRSVFKKAVE